MLVDESHIQAEQTETGGSPELDDIEIFSVEIDITAATNDFWGACINLGA